MKHSFKSLASRLFCFLFLSSVVSQPIKPAAIAGSIAAVEVGIIAAEVAAAIGYALSVHTQTIDYVQQELSYNAPEIAGIQIQNIPLEGKSDQDVVNAIAQKVTTAIGEKYGLNHIERRKLWDTVQLQYPEHVQTLRQNRSMALSQTHARFQSITANLRHANRLRDAQLREKAIAKAVYDFFEANARAHHPDNEADTQKTFRGITNLFINCNSENLARRIEARTWLSHVSQCDPYVFGYKIKEAALNLQERYFDHNNDLVNLSYDKRLPETIKTFLQEYTYSWDTEYLEEQLHGQVQEKNLDSGHAFELMRRRDAAGGVSGWDKFWGSSRSYEECKVKNKFFLFRHGDRRKEIFENTNNHRLYAVASLAEHGNFKDASQLAKSHTDYEAIRICRNKLCNQYGILKKYEHLPTWQNLPLREKKHIAKFESYQDNMNLDLEAEWLAERAALFAKKSKKKKAKSKKSKIATQRRTPSPPMPDQNPEDDRDPKTGKKSDRSTVQKVRKMEDFFKTKVGQPLKKVSRKLGEKNGYIYQVTKKTEINGTTWQKGWYYYLDKQHWDHIEVFDSLKRAVKVFNLDGTINAAKTDVALKAFRTIKNVP